MNKLNKAIYDKEYRIKNKDKIREYWNTKEYKEKSNERRKKRYPEHREKMLLRQKNKYKNDSNLRAKILSRKYYYKYGITFEEKNRIVLQQENKCKICGNVFKNARDTHVDHDHNTGKLREILCRKCNYGLGNFKDNVYIMQKAIDYLNKWKGV
jgi:hypothetical protein